MIDVMYVVFKLQKQRQLRQEEEKQAGLMAAIRDLQQKTLHQNFQLQPPNLPTQRPHLPHLQPQGFAPGVNRSQAPLNVPPFRHNFSMPGSQVRDTHNFNVPPPSIAFGDINIKTTPPPSVLNNSGYLQSNNLPPGRLASIPPFNANSFHSAMSTPPCFSGAQHTAMLQPPGRSVGNDFVGSAPPDSKSRFPIHQPPGFEPGHIAMTPSGSERSVHTANHFGKFADKSHSSPYILSSDHASDNLTTNNSRSPLVDVPRKRSPADFPGLSSDRHHQSSPSPHRSQENAPSRSWSATGRMQAGGRERDREGASSKSVSGEAERGDRRSVESSRSHSGSIRSDKRSSSYRSERDRNGSRDVKDSRDRNSSRDRNDSRDGNSSRDVNGSRDGSDGRDRDDRRSPGRRQSGRDVERTSDRYRSRGDSRFSDHRRSASHSQSRDRKEAPRHESGRHNSSALSDRSSSYQESRKRNRPHTSSRERSPSGTRDGHSRSKIRHTASPPGKDSSFRRERLPTRSRSPSSSDQTYSGQLSQYRQDLLNSESNTRSQNSPSPRQKQPDGDDDDCMDNKEEELQLEADSSSYFTRSCPADLYFTKNTTTGDMEATARMIELENRFEEEIMKRAEKVRATQTIIEEPPVQQVVHHDHHHHHHHCSGNKSSSSCDSSSDGEDNDDDDEGSCSQIMEEWDKRKKHPHSLHPELWFNLKGQVCRCLRLFHYLCFVIGRVPVGL